MKKNKRLLIVSLILVIVAAGLYFGGGSTGFNKADSDFAINDTSTITKFFLANKNNYHVLISRDSTNGGWLVDRTYKASSRIVADFLGMATQLQVKTPAPATSRDNIIKLMSSSAIKLEVYQILPRFELFGYKFFEREVQSKVYYVGEAAPDNQGSYMLMQGSSLPFVVFMPGLRGFVTPYYSVIGDQWRDHTIFAENLDNIKSVKMAYRDKPEESFELVNNGNKTLSLNSLMDGANIPVFDTLVALTYLNGFSSVNFETLLNNKGERYIDSLKALPPFFTLSVTLMDGTVKKLSGYEKESSGDVDETGRPYEFDLDRLYALINDDKDLVLLQYFSFGKMMIEKKMLINQPSK